VRFLLFRPCRPSERRIVWNDAGGQEKRKRRLFYRKRVYIKNRRKKLGEGKENFFAETGK
jgi:hypothetical protein